jgi:hypothetical protein
LLKDPCAVGDILHDALLALEKIGCTLTDIVSLPLVVYATSATEDETYGGGASLRASNAITVVESMLRCEVKR